MAIMDPDPVVIDDEASAKAVFVALAVMAASIRGDEKRVMDILRQVHRDGYDAGAKDMRAEMKPEAYR